MKIIKILLLQYSKYWIILVNKIFHNKQKSSLEKYFEDGQIPWTEGYIEHKNNSIIESINSPEILNKISYLEKNSKYGYRLDERIVEYPWIFKNLENTGFKLLDAGSTFNFNFILDHHLIKEKELTIFTYSPENPNYNEKRISYVYGDLRRLPFKDDYFDVVVSQSTIEHIDMNNSMYGYEIDYNKKEETKSFEFIEAIKEMIRVLKPAGMLLITFPFGKFENHDFFQQFDKEMLEKLLNVFQGNGTYKHDFFRYLPEGWVSCNESDCKEIISFNPHSKSGEGNDGAAHCRSICCLKFIKNS
jgi:SAM-dependent methyltransferase